MSTPELVRQLRDKTGAGFMECKKALIECNNDLERAAEYLREKGILKAEKRQGKAAAEGIVHCYIHSNAKVGALVELNCETDFVAKTDEFKKLAHDIAMQIAASYPKYLDKTSVPVEDVEREKRILAAEVENSGKTGPMVAKIVDGKLAKFFEDKCLLHQPYIKDPKVSIERLIKESIGKLGENIAIRRFARFQLGENLKEGQSQGAE